MYGRRPNRNSSSKKKKLLRYENPRSGTGNKCDSKPWRHAFRRSAYHNDTRRECYRPGVCVFPKMMRHEHKNAHIFWIAACDGLVGLRTIIEYIRVCIYTDTKCCEGHGVAHEIRTVLIWYTILYAFVYVYMLFDAKDVVVSGLRSVWCRFNLNGLMSGWVYRAWMSFRIYIGQVERSIGFY